MAVDFSESEDHIQAEDDQAGEDEQAEIKQLVENHDDNPADQHLDELPDGYRADDLILDI